jgi:hypothetical protein
MDCPECKHEMRWIGDQYIEEDELLQEVYDCKSCQIEVIKNKKTSC